MKLLPFSFYFGYSRNTSKHGKYRKGIMTLLCAFSVAFCAMSTGYLGEFSDYLNQNMRNVTDRLLTVTNSVGNGSADFNLAESAGNCPMTAEEVQAMREIEGIEQMEPFVLFPSISLFSASNTMLLEGGDVDEPEYEKSFICNVFLKNSDGLSTHKVINSNAPEKREPDDIPGVTFCAVSYPSEENMERRSFYVDESVENGVYLSSTFAEMLGITEKDLNGLTIEIDLMVPVCRMDGYILVGGMDEDAEYERVKNYREFHSRDTLQLNVRGIFEGADFDYSRFYIYLPAETLLKEIEKIEELRMDEAEKYVRVCNELFGDTQGESQVIKWTPNTYYITVENVQDIERIKGELARINPNFVVLHEYQDIEAGTQIIDNNRNVMLYISFAVLAVALLLMALIYVSLIDRRKFEFALLRANGFTKKEVRKLIYTEMLWQFLKIFLFGIICATLIYLIGRVWLGYPFQFDGMTALWLFVISLGSIILPTIISLLFVNKFEPDQVMRN